MIGRKNYLYIRTGGSWAAAPTYTELKRCSDVTHGDSRAEGNSSIRGFDMASVTPGQRTYECTFELVYKRADTACEALRTAYNAGTPVEIMALDGPKETVGSTGFRVEVHVTQFGRNEPLADATKIPVALKGTTDEDHELTPVTIAE